MASVYNGTQDKPPTLEDTLRTFGEDGQSAVGTKISEQLRLNNSVMPDIYQKREKRDEKLAEDARKAFLSILQMENRSRSQAPYLPYYEARALLRAISQDEKGYAEYDKLRKQSVREALLLYAMNSEIQLISSILKKLAVFNRKAPDPTILALLPSELHTLPQENQTIGKLLEKQSVALLGSREKIAQFKAVRKDDKGPLISRVVRAIEYFIEVNYAPNGGANYPLSITQVNGGYVLNPLMLPLEVYIPEMDKRFAVGLLGPFDKGAYKLIIHKGPMNPALRSYDSVAAAREKLEQYKKDQSIIVKHYGTRPR